jgi:copper chaperone CopZ
MTTSTKTTSILTIDGMKCNNCAGRVEKEIRSLTGVYEAAIDLTAKTAAVTYDATKVDIQKIAAAVEHLGHGYQVIKD